MERILASLLKGDFLHCRPVEGGLTIMAPIIPFDEEETPTFKVVIVCPKRIPSSKCQLRVELGDGDGHCHYYKGDSRGEYQIIGPGMDKKSESGYRNI